MQAPPGSVTRCIQQLKAGDSDAFQKIWDHYFEELLEVARGVMRQRRRWSVVDEDDIVQNALLSVCRGIPKNKSYDKVNSRESLWPILVAITKFKVADNFRRENAAKRGGGRVVSEAALERNFDSSSAVGLAQLVADDSPAPQDIVEMSEQLHLLMSLLPREDLKRIARLHLEGWKNHEIAEELEMSTRSVERKLALVRDAWLEWWQSQEDPTT
ncbi:MAG: RNA polymerase subunit sigma-70 [Planctomycetes bacterium]|nr:RNA polymerase subunit sigma-70 [Planctomycetota bacterium]